MILACFMLGLATRKVAAALLPVLGRKISAGTVSAVAKSLDGAVAAMPMVYPDVPVQRCWAHKIRNVLNKVRRADQGPVKKGLHAVMNAATLPQARAAARGFADRWRESYPNAVACLRDDLDELFTCWRYKRLPKRKHVRDP